MDKPIIEAFNLPYVLRAYPAEPGNAQQLHHLFYLNGISVGFDFPRLALVFVKDSIEYLVEAGPIIDKILGAHEEVKEKAESLPALEVSTNAAQQKVSIPTDLLLAYREAVDLVGLQAIALKKIDAFFDKVTSIEGEYTREGLLDMAHTLGRVLHKTKELDHLMPAK